MTALIADTSPTMRSIPSDPAADHRSFGFSPSPMPARYLSEGHTERQSPNPRSSYNKSREMPSHYPHGYGYTAVEEDFTYDDPRAPARIPRKSCPCQHHCVCTADSKMAQSDAASSMWRKDNNSHNNHHHHHHHHNNMRSGFIGGGEAFHFGRTARSDVSVSEASSLRSQSLSPVSARDLSNVDLRSPPRKSDWENLLGAVDLELRAQRAELVPEPAPTAVPHYSPAAGRAPLHPSVGNNRFMSAAISAATSVSPELAPQKPTHRRGGRGRGDEISGGGPAYSGSTADAACLLATLPQRMLDRASLASSAADETAAAVAPLKPTPVVMSSPALVSASGPAVTPVRVQASGRRGPRGQSRFKGVCITRAGKWRAVIYIGRKQKYLGVFDSEFDAARAYDAAALQHFAEGAKLNFPDGVEQQLNEISSGGSGKPFATAGAGGSAAAPSSTPPALEGSGGRKRSRKSNTFGEHDDDDQWVRHDGSGWNSSSRR